MTNTVVISLGVGIVTILALAPYQYDFFFSLLVVYLAGCGCLLILYWLSRSNFLEKVKKLSPLVRILKASRQLYAKRRLFLKLALLQIGMLVSFAARYYLILKMLGHEVVFWKVFSVVPLIYLGKIIRILPANLGIQEFIAMVGTRIIGYPLGVGLLVAIIDRLITVIGNFGSGIYFFRKLKYSENI